MPAKPALGSEILKKKIIRLVTSHSPPLPCRGNWGDFKVRSSISTPRRGRESAGLPCARFSGRRVHPLMRNRSPLPRRVRPVRSLADAVPFQHAPEEARPGRVLARVVRFPSQAPSSGPPRDEHTAFALSLSSHAPPPSPARSSLLPCSRKCGNNHGLIRKYHMMLCRRCFRENAGACPAADLALPAPREQREILTALRPSPPPAQRPLVSSSTDKL